MQQIPVQDYTIYVGDIFSALNEYIATKATGAIVIIVDENTEKHCLPILRNQLERKDGLIIKIPAGEVHKNIQTCQQVWQIMMDKGLNRNALCLNLGGCLLYTSPSPRDATLSRMPSSA